VSTFDDREHDYRVPLRKRTVATGVLTGVAVGTIAMLAWLYVWFNAPVETLRVLIITYITVALSGKTATWVIHALHRRDQDQFDRRHP
jgi:hypothetical protein